MFCNTKNLVKCKNKVNFICGIICPSYFNKYIGKTSNGHFSHSAIYRHLSKWAKSLELPVVNRMNTIFSKELLLCKVIVGSFEILDFNDSGLS